MQKIELFFIVIFVCIYNTKMYCCIEFAFYLLLALIWFYTGSVLFRKDPIIKKLKIDNDLLTKYNNVLNEYYYNECSYKNIHTYENLWINNNKNGFNVIHNNNITISGFKKDNLFDGLVRIDGMLLNNNELKNIDCIYENGIQKSCFVINKKNRIVFVVPEQVVVVL